MAAEIEVDVEKGRMTVTGDVNWSEHQKFQAAIDKLVTSEEAELVIDLARAVFVFSSVVASLLTAAAEIGSRGKTIHLVIPQTLDWLKRYLAQNAASGDIKNIVIRDA
ncbi:MAG: STAS domain-containing protein [Planctomycetes bacterium]|nr:STAS domain-containing protein [Planctomycetota bacterium]